MKTEFSEVLVAKLDSVLLDKDQENCMEQQTFYTYKPWIVTLAFSIPTLQQLSSSNCMSVCMNPKSHPPLKPCFFSIMFSIIRPIELHKYIVLPLLALQDSMPFKDSFHKEMISNSIYFPQYILKEDLFLRQIWTEKVC